MTKRTSLPEGRREIGRHQLELGKQQGCFFCCFLNKYDSVSESVQQKVSRGISGTSSLISIVRTVKFHSVKMVVFLFFTIVKL